MLTTGLITFREGLEAALIIGIVLSYLYKIGHRAHARYAWAGVILAIAVSISIALGLQWVGARLEEPYEQIFEGITMLLAVVVLTWMIFWMRYQGRFVKRDLEQKVHAAVTSGARAGIFGIAFFAVLREGIETALFLSASAFADDALVTLIGAVAGLAIAAALGYAMFALSVRIDLRRFFDVTSLLLLIVAAGLFAHAVHEFQEIGWLPILSQQAWDLTQVLPNSSVAGSILRSMIGYNATPTVLEVAAYVGYWVVVLFGVRLWMQRVTSQVTASPMNA
jgi:high-affinity iron transporter